MSITDTAPRPLGNPLGHIGTPNFLFFYGLTFTSIIAAIAFRNGKTRGAWIKLQEKYSFSPPFDWGRSAIFDGDHPQSKRYKRYLKEVARPMKKNQDWVEKYLRLEFGKV